MTGPLPLLQGAGICQWLADYGPLLQNMHAVVAEHSDRGACERIEDYFPGIRSLCCCFFPYLSFPSFGLEIFESHGPKALYIGD
jgi:hypothetical protein